MQLSGLGHTSPEHVNILLGTYNGASWLPAQLDSFLAQTHQDWSLWISDDGSTDGTRALLHEFAAAHPGRVACILDGPRQGSAANYLHLMCHPELPVEGIVALSDQDDMWMPDKLARAVGYLRTSEDTPCAWAARYLITDAHLAAAQVSKRWPRVPSLRNALVQNILSGHTLTFNAPALQIVRQAGPQSVPHHDWWLYLLLSATGTKIRFDPAIVLRYRQHKDNAMGTRERILSRLKRVGALFGGTLRSWMEGNLQALARAPVSLTPEAAHLLRCWPEAGRLTRLRLLRELGIHRQSRGETLMVYLAVAVGKV